MERKLGIISLTKVLKIFERSRTLLKSYRIGKLPRILNILPLMKNFEELLWFLRPDLWSQQAILTVTRKFVLNLELFQVHRFLTQVFLPRFQETIFKGKKIEPAFVKTLKNISKKEGLLTSSFIFPIVKGNNCSSKELFFLYFILNRTSLSKKEVNLILIQITHEIRNPNFFLLIQVLISKNNPLPIKVVDILVDSFVSAKRIRKNPKVRTCFLVFLRNYRHFISEEDKRKLLILFDFSKPSV